MLVKKFDLDLKNLAINKNLFKNQNQPFFIPEPRKIDQDKRFSLYPLLKINPKTFTLIKIPSQSALEIKDP